MSISNKKYTFLLGAQQDANSTSITFSAVISSDNYGIPEPMFKLTEEGFRMKNGEWYNYAEDILRKQILAGQDAESGCMVVYLADCVYDSDLQITPTNVSILNKMEALEFTAKNVETKKTVAQIFSEHHIANAFVIRDKRVPAYGERDLLAIYFKPSVTSLGNLYEQRPITTAYMNNLIDFLKTIQTGIFI